MAEHPKTRRRAPVEPAEQEGGPVRPDAPENAAEVPSRPATAPRFSWRVMDKAKGLDVEPDPDHESVWWVVGGSLRKPYRVQVLDRPYDGAATCSCPWGQHKSGVASGGCSHVAAVLMLLGVEVVSEDRTGEKK